MTFTLSLQICKNRLRRCVRWWSRRTGKSNNCFWSLRTSNEGNLHSRKSLIRDKWLHENEANAETISPLTINANSPNHQWASRTPSSSLSISTRTKAVRKKPSKPSSCPPHNPPVSLSNRSASSTNSGTNAAAVNQMGTLSSRLCRSTRISSLISNVFNK